MYQSMFGVFLSPSSLMMCSRPFVNGGPYLRSICNLDMPLLLPKASVFFCCSGRHKFDAPLFSFTSPAVKNEGENRYNHSDSFNFFHSFSFSFSPLLHFLLYFFSHHTPMKIKLKRHKLFGSTMQETLTVEDHSHDSCDAVEKPNIGRPSSDKSTKPFYNPAGATSEPNPPTTKTRKVPKPQKWINWAGNQTCHPSRILRPTTVQDIVDIVKVAKEEQKTIRCVAGAHTWSSSSVVEGGLLVFVNRMIKIFPPIYVEGKGWTVELETGVTVRALDDYLRKHDPPLAMPASTVMETVRKKGTLVTKMKRRRKRFIKTLFFYPIILDMLWWDVGPRFCKPCCTEKSHH